MYIPTEAEYNRTIEAILDSTEREIMKVLSYEEVADQVVLKLLESGEDFANILMRKMHEEGISVVEFRNLLKGRRHVGPKFAPK